ncbi:MAG: cob(I)yrinic acid a,c-diamide adenosyltransferase [Candidatus Syntrophosphaera sp.]
MSITTKTGDSGQTSLYNGERLWKDDIRVEAYGTLDELNAFICDARHLVEDPTSDDILDGIQEKLSRLMSELASTDGSFKHPLGQTEVDRITDQIHALEKKTALRGFVKCASTKASARLDICRAVARRAERCVVRLSRVQEVNPHVIHYLNRLSDLLFILARSLEKDSGTLKYR